MIDNISKPLKSDWPKCYKCGSTALVFGGDFFSCCQCGIVDNCGSIEATLVSKIARGRMSMMPFGNFPVMRFYTAESSGEEPCMVEEKGSQITRRLIHQAVILEAKKTIKPGAVFAPIVVGQYIMSDMRYVSMPLHNSDLSSKAKVVMMDYDVCSVMWISEDVDEDEFSDKNEQLKEVKEKGRLIINTHFYGAPSISCSIPFRISGGAVKFSKMKFSNSPIKSWIDQPVEWSIIHSVAGRVQPRWLSIRNIPGVVNINACICEDLDSGSFGGIFIKDLSSIPRAFSFQKIPCNSCDEGIALVKSKIEEMDLSFSQNSITESVKFDGEWGLEKDPDTIVLEIRSANFWEKDAKKRNENHL